MSALQGMLADIEAEAQSAAPWTGSATIDARVLAAMAAVPRHEFVPAELAASAYANHPCPSAMVRPSPSPISSP